MAYGSVSLRGIPVHLINPFLGISYSSFYAGQSALARSLIRVWIRCLA